MIDRVTLFERGERAEGVKNVTLSEDILGDHFPDYPVFPGALMIEAMAQLGGFLLEMSLNEPGHVRRALLGQVDKAKFYIPVEPGDQMVIAVTLDQQMEDAARVKGEVRVGEERVAMAALTFVLKQLDSQRIHEQRRYYYKLWTRKLDNIPDIL
jgi:3-hydroxyacyl-[acyl-carrier-protein] dehydratase